MKAFVAAVAILVAGCAFRRGAGLEIETTVLDAPRAAAVAIFTPCDATASGVIVGDRLLLTAAHAVCPDHSRSAFYLVEGADGSRYLAILDMLDAKRDVARLRLVVGRFPHTPTPRIKGIRSGEWVCAFTGRPRRKITCGVVRSVRPGEAGIFHAARIVGGNSGSGLYDTEGNLVGIVVWRREDDSADGWSTPLEGVRWVLE